MIDFINEIRLIPVDFGLRLQARARKSTMLKLENFMELRDFIAENEEAIARDGWMAFYEDAGNWMDYSANSVRKGLTIIRSYPDDRLLHWISKGLSFDHIERANELQNVEECHYEAAHLLDAAIDLGGADGKRMTVSEMETFALGEQVTEATKIQRFINGLLGRLINFPRDLGWDKEKTSKFTVWIDAGKEFFK